MESLASRGATFAGRLCRPFACRQAPTRQDLASAFTYPATMQTRDPKLLPHALMFIAVVLVLGLAHQWVNPWLRYDRAAVAGGEVWRLVTAHLVHLISGMRC